MKALVLKNYNHFSFEDVPQPKPEENEVLVAVKACGICGSDVHGMDGSTGRRRPPVIMGHEAAGVIQEVGKSVTGWTPGERVTFDSTIYCGKCEFCQSGQINLCKSRRVLGVSCDEYRQDGAFAQFVKIPQHILYRLPQALAFEYAALIEPYAIGLHAVRRSKFIPGTTAVVVGAGMIGLTIIQALKHAGARQIVSIDLMEDRLALAQKCGATHTINSAQQTQEKLSALMQGAGADFAFEAVGISSTVELALQCVRRGGNIVLVGNLSPSISFPLQNVVTRELTILGSCASRGEYPDCIDMLARGFFNPTLLIGAVAPLSEGAEWFSRLYKKEAGLLKVVLKP
jgi:L-iditol 2-dehydrogenase